MNDAFICDAIRTPIGRYGGALQDVRADDLGAVPIKALIERNPGVNWQALDDVIYGCANQAGDDNRNVARMAALLAGLPTEASGTTINRLCGSGMDAVGTAARAIKAAKRGYDRRRRRKHDARAIRDGQGHQCVLAAGRIYDTTIGWRFINPLMKRQYGVDSMPETAENVGRRVRHKPCGSGCVCAVEPAKGSARAARWHVGSGNRRR
jgi:Acetyl-CoA acetyltransferase